MDFSKFNVETPAPRIVDKTINPVFSPISGTTQINYQGCSKCGAERNFRINRDSATCLYCGHTYNFAKRE